MPDQTRDSKQSTPSTPGPGATPGSTTSGRSAPTGSAGKVCFGCKGDCSNKARVKDPAGHYWCKECFDKADALEKQRLATVAKPVVAGAVLDDGPLVFTADEIGGARACVACKTQLDEGVVFCTLCGADQNAVPGAAAAVKASKLRVQKQALTVRARATKSARIVNAGEFAGLWRRFAAHLLDGILLGLVIGVPTVLLSGGPRMSDQLGRADAMSPNSSQLTIQIVFTLAWIAYGTLLEGFTGATLGKKALGLIVGTTESGEIGLLGSLVRNCCKIFVSGGMFTFGGFVGGVMAGAAGITGPGVLVAGAIASLVIGFAPWLLSVVTTRRQTLHDLMSGAVVVN